MSDDAPDSLSRDIPGASADTLAAALERIRAKGRRRSKLAEEQEAERQSELRQTAHQNREAALRGPVDIAGTPHWWCVCVCRWSSLRVPDPEAAKREYDKHPCSINGDAAVDRALREIEQTNLDTQARTTKLTKRPASTLIPALAEQRTSVDERLIGGVDRADVVVEQQQEQGDATEQRMSLLELK